MTRMANLIPPGGANPAPRQPRRSVPKLVIGIVLTVLGVVGALNVLRQLPTLRNVPASVGSLHVSAAAYHLGQGIAVALVLIVLLVGILLIRTSKRRA